jgi:hypothetical protein
MKKADTDLRPCLWLVYEHEMGYELQFLELPPTDSATGRYACWQTAWLKAQTVRMMVQMVGLTVQTARRQTARVRKRDRSVWR